MRLLVDQAVSWRVAADLAEAGHDVVHVRDRAMQSAADAEIIALAHEEERTILTQDTDFGTLLVTETGQRVSVVMLRSRHGAAQHQAQLLLRALPQVEQALAGGAIVVVSDSSVRVRDLP